MGLKKSLAFLSGILLFACTKEQQVSWKINSISLNHVQNNGAQPEISMADTLSMKCYGIRININGEVTHDTGGHFINGESFVNCDNLPDSILVTSNSSFDSLHPAFTNLSTRFSCYNGSYTDTTSLNKIKIVPYYNTDFPAEKIPKSFHLLLTHPSATGSFHKFYVKFYKSGSISYQDSTSTIYLKP